MDIKSSSKMNNALEFSCIERSPKTGKETTKEKKRTASDIFHDTTFSAKDIFHVTIFSLNDECFETQDLKTFTAFRRILTLPATTRPTRSKPNQEEVDVDEYGLMVEPIDKRRGNCSSLAVAFV